MRATFHPIKEMQFQVVSDILLALAACFSVATIQAAGNPDAFTIVGAIIATLIVMLEAREKRRSWLKTSTLVLGSLFTGAVAPGWIMWTWFRETAPHAPWQAWAGLGF